MISELLPPILDHQHRICTFEFLEAAFWSHEQVELPLTVTFVLASLNTRHSVHYSPAYILASNPTLKYFASIILYHYPYAMLEPTDLVL